MTMMARWVVCIAAASSAAWGAAGCKKKARPPAPRVQDEEPGGTPSDAGSPTRRFEVDGVIYNIIEPPTEPDAGRPGGALRPVRDEFACPGAEALEPTEPDPQPGFGLEHLWALFPDMPREKVQVKIDTDQGPAECEVWPQVAPRAAAVFLGLATGARAWWHPCERRWVAGRPYYDKTRFTKVAPAGKLETGCLYEGCEAAAGFEVAFDDAGPALDRAGLMIAPRAGPAGAFALVDCQWVPAEPVKPLQGACHMDPAVAGMAAEWVAFGACPHAGITDVIYRLARVARDRHIDPHAIYWIRATKPGGGYYRHVPEPPAGGADAGAAETPGPAEEPTPQPATPGTGGTAAQ